MGHSRGQSGYLSLFLFRLYQRELRPGLSAAVEPPWKVDVPHPLRDKLNEVEVEIQRMLQGAYGHDPQAKFVCLRINRNPQPPTNLTC